MVLCGNSGKFSRLPEWLRVRLPEGPEYAGTRALLGRLELHTVCQGARCPNIFECFSHKVAAFMILGATCTRACAFCNIGHAPESRALARPDLDEPARLARAAVELGLEHVVVTSVTRDDLPDGGAAQFAAVVAALRRELPTAGVELLIPDFRGSREALDVVLAAGPDIVNHNVETVPALYPEIRPQAVYGRSIELLRRVRATGLTSKSGFMVGLGEDDAAVRALLADLAEAGCDIVTVGQYLAPSRRHPAPRRYVPPKMFERYAAWGRELGIARMHCAPLVRSSYNAGNVLGKDHGSDLEDSVTTGLPRSGP